MKSPTFKKIIEDMEGALKELRLKFNSQKISMMKYNKEKNDQLIKIEFFKKGYNFYKREAKQQSKL